MATTVEHICETCRQVSGNDATGQPILSVLVKRTYLVGDEGHCRLSEEQLPLVEEPQVDSDGQDTLIHDLDLFPLKPATDVIVTGHVYNHHPRPRTEASVKIAGHEKRVLVVGNRSCALDHSGNIVFSEPAPLEKVPLSYIHAFGGRDVAAEAKYGDPFVEAMGPSVQDADAERASVFRYPRNPAGRGYLMEATAEAVDQLHLPNLEDPLDPLTPERLVVGSPLNWAKMPLPQATGWVNYDWFPRVSYFGFPPHAAPLDKPLAEVERGYAPATILERRTIDTADAFRLTCGASLGLQLPHLKGGQQCELVNIHPKLSRFRFGLPGDRPKIWTDGRKGKLNETDPVLHTVVIEPDQSQLIVVWRGSAPALRPYLPEELERMPFRVEW